jgi:hypothetical protein
MPYGPPEDSPLNNKDYTNLQRSLAAVNKAERLIEDAEKAGVPCDERKAECSYIRDRIERLKAQYFPHKP